MCVNPSLPFYPPAPYYPTISLSSWTWRGVPLKTTSVFFSLSVGLLVNCVCACVRACVCVQSRGGYMFGLVRLSVYVCVQRCGSVRQNFSVISFPCFCQRSTGGWLRPSKVEFFAGQDSDILGDKPSVFPCLHPNPSLPSLPRPWP